MVIAGVVAGVAGAAAGAYGSHQAAGAQKKAVKAGSKAASAELQLAQDKWDFQKNIYLPKAMAAADDQLALSHRVADRQIQTQDMLDAQARESFDQAKKSYKYQDQYMGMVDDYTSGKTANTMADEANADVEQSYAGSAGALARNAGRYGINPNSGAYEAATGDLYTSSMLARAGGQTQARRQARDKAEQMVGIAAGSGANGFATGLSAAGLSTGAGSAAVGSGAAGGNAYGQVSNNYGQGAGSDYASSSNAYSRLAGEASNSPLASFSSGLLSSGLKAYGSGSFGSPSSAGMNAASSIGNSNTPGTVNTGYYGIDDIGGP